MKYYSAIIFLFASSIFAVVLLLYFANITRNIEKENFVLLSKIKKIEDQININEIELSFYNSYEYLLKMQKIYSWGNNFYKDVELNSDLSENATA